MTTLKPTADVVYMTEDLDGRLDLGALADEEAKGPAEASIYDATDEEAQNPPFKPSNPRAALVLSYASAGSVVLEGDLRVLSCGKGWLAQLENVSTEAALKVATTCSREPCDDARVFMNGSLYFILRGNLDFTATFDGDVCTFEASSDSASSA